ncbi:signal transduction histidine kinase [Enterococcus sp. PF1-24]|uniref:sensor histidine kinase n=1 Tax=unclassified Enterococcus TaxID=2608891 RepID=UPI002476948B|nr:MULTISPECIES: HAMP domain-containing sensor histidine kinase [unclassified Enterococcus]MDH6365596.1 signal transduction histidine kinase [Enterococcus sp. PFB1-1]MDH6402688.1 signal transduction histidine kinase [Enterococcus sp. PF1-24]
MKYLYQQLIAFCTVILVVIAIISASFVQLARNSMEESNYQQLTGYLESINASLKGNKDAEINFDRALKQTLDYMDDFVLRNQKVDIIFEKNDGTLFTTTDKEIQLPLDLTEDELNQLMDTSRQVVVKKTLDTNLHGEKEKTSYVFYSIKAETVLTNEIETYGILVVVQATKNLDQSVDALTSNMLRGLIVSFVVAALISYYIVKIQLRRINSLKKATRQIAEGEFDIQIPSRGRDEFDELAEDFNKMATSLKASHEEIENQEERRKQFMADASHEMRTPLTTIKGLLEGMEHNAIPENQRENAIKLMQNETERLIRLVNENLDYERIRTNQISIMVKKLNATEILKLLLTQLEEKAKTTNNQLVLLTEEPIMVYADYDRFVQIMVNILQNALQFTKDGTISVKVEKGYMETIVTISDTGIGMDQEQLQNIWERYYKADPSRKNTKYGESGLGLSIVHQLVELHNGSVDVESEVNKGTTFRISFPDVEAPQKKKKRKKKRPTGTNANDAKKVRKPQQHKNNQLNKKD